MDGRPKRPDKREERHQILVAGDFNDYLNDDQSRISQMMRGLGLRNLLKDSNGNGPNTYNRGTKQLMEPLQQT